MSENFNEYIYSYQNQSENDIHKIFSLEISLNFILIDLLNKSIFLKNKNSTLCINEIKYIYILDEFNALGVIFNIVCGSEYLDYNEVSCVIIAR